MNERDLEKYLIAQAILEKAEVIERCEIHDECCFYVEHDLEPAYKIAASGFKQGNYAAFMSQKELTDTIKAVFDDTPSSECVRCSDFEEDE